MSLSKFLFFYILLTLSTYAYAQKTNKQTASDLEFYSKVMEKSDPDFQIMSDNGRWDDAPLVVLCEKTHIMATHRSNFYLSRRGRSVDEPTHIRGVYRVRVLIKKKNLAEQFSEYYFQDGETVGITHIKPDGTKTEIDLGEAIEVNTSIPEYFRNGFRSSQYYKTTIPNLEVGDILEYFTIFEEFRQPSLFFSSTFKDEYPTIKKEITFDVDNIWRTYYNTFNTDVQFEFNEGVGKSIKGDQKEKIDRIVLAIENVEALEGERYVNYKLEEPYFKIYFVSSKAESLLSNDELFNSSFDARKAIDHVLLPIDKKAVNLFSSYTLKKVRRELKISKEEPLKVPDAVFYSLRYMLSLSSTPAGMVESIFYRFSTVENEFAKQYGQVNDKYALHSFSFPFKKYNIPFDYVTFVPHYVGGIDQVISIDELVFGVYVPELDKYYWAPSMHMAVNDTPISIAYGGQAIHCSSNEVGQAEAQYKVYDILPCDHEKNSTLNRLSVNVDLDSLSLDVSAECEVSGINKSFDYYLLPKYSDYILQDFFSMYSGKFVDMKGVKETEYTIPIIQELKEASEQIQDGAFKNWSNDLFDVESAEVSDFEILHTGRTSEHSSMQYKVKFDVNEFIAHAGPNYIFEIGRLIGGQRQLSESEIEERHYNVDIGFPRQFKNELVIDLPEGYIAKGLDALNMNIDSDYMSFISEAKLEGNSIRVETTKAYKNTIIPKEQWQDAVDMLEAAYNFSQKKVILSKE